MLHRKTFITFTPGKVESIEYLMAIINDARVTTLQRVQGLSVEELDWQYAPGWNTIGALLSHIISVQNYFRINFIEGRECHKEEEQKWLAGLELGAYVPSLITGKTIKEYEEELSASLELILDRLSNLSSEDFTKRLEDYDPETGHNLAWSIYHMAEDEIHHRGQISILRKLYKSR